jgi:alpha-L-rhamnosidase
VNSPKLLIGSVLLGIVFSISAAPIDSLESGFLNLPDSAKPQTWWHWMNGNITQEGITADLEAMHRVGISEANIITIDFNLMPPGPVRTMSPQFLDLVLFAAQEAKRLGMTLCINNCSGWSNSGGP